jgi:hypothetical protein
MPMLPHSLKQNQSYHFCKNAGTSLFGKCVTINPLSWPEALTMVHERMFHSNACTRKHACKKGEEETDMQYGSDEIEPIYEEYVARVISLRYSRNMHAEMYARFTRNQQGMLITGARRWVKIHFHQFVLSARSEHYRTSIVLRGHF